MQASRLTPCHHLQVSVIATGRGVDWSGRSPHLDKKTEVLTNEPATKQCLACNCTRPTYLHKHCQTSISYTFKCSAHNHKAIELSNPLYVVTMLWLTPSRSYWRRPYKASMEVKFKPQTLCNPRKGCGRAPHLFLSTPTTSHLIAPHQNGLILTFILSSMFTYFTSQFCSTIGNEYPGKYALTRRGW